MTTLTLSNAQSATPQELAKTLVDLAYERVDIVYEKGQFAIRGGIVDIFPINHSHPIRVEIDFTTIDRIASFDPHTQRTFSPIKTTSIATNTHTHHTPFPELPLLTQAPLFTDFEIGDFVVHESYGIGQFKGLIRLTTQRYEGEYLFIQYKGKDKVYVPVNQLDKLHLYAHPDITPKLNGLNDGAWTRTKERTQRAIIVMVEEIYHLFKERLKKNGFAFKEDTEHQVEFEHQFPYTLTKDQETAIAEIKEDLEAPYPMDRLICGDVGFGKTEVILRAAFKAVENEKQVAILVPTTILAEQHYQTFKNRFKDFPYRIELVSRFVPQKKQEATIKDLKKHRVDILIGTHRMIQKDVQFADLGLLVIDEEHRFGVSHKEKLKQIAHTAPNVDMITVSATPIPRTLYMALTGGRHISSIQTPPIKRKPIITYVEEYSDATLKSAVEFEINRRGKVFYVYNSVEKIMQKYHFLSTLFPTLTISVAHGQMGEATLRKGMSQFLSPQGQVLLCTTIIENGLDIPQANTIIIENAHQFGLSQIHQLRGRVGRKDSQAYAYLFYPASHTVTEIAQKRLNAIKQYAALGAGYKLALKDLEIRGAGTLLGNAQSGHMTSVGFEMYCQLLEDAVNASKGTKRKERPPILKEEFSAIPEDYIPTPKERLSMYQKLNAITSIQGLTHLEAELKDRYGPLPKLMHTILDSIEREL